MKRKVIWAFSLVLFLLISCSLFSIRIEKLMIPKVVKTSAGYQKPTLPLDALFVDDTGMHLYSIYEGAGWEKGVRTSELGPDSFQLMETGVKLQYGGDFIRYASRPLWTSEVIEVQSKSEKRDDVWLVIFSEGLPTLDSLSNKLTVESEAGNALLLSVAEAERPFMADRAASMVSPPTLETLFFDGEKPVVYSLLDIEQFLKNVPLLVLLLALLLLPIILWGYSCRMISESKKNRKPLLVNGVIALVSLAAMAVTLHFVVLPSSLLPQSHIVDFSHYRAEFTQAFRALEAFASSDQETAGQILSLAGTVRWASIVILCGGVVLAAVFILTERLHSREKGRHLQESK